jgi:hypothetical protein
VLAAAILEDVLWRNARNRKLAIREQIDSPATLNQKLCDAGVYPIAIKQKVDTWMALAGVPGGESSQAPSQEEVTTMIKGVRNFVADFLI